MARHAQTLIAGTIVATALYAASANSVQAQEASLVLNEQLLFGDVFAGQRLNVVEVRQQVTVANTALGNQINGGSEGQGIAFQNRQSSHGDAHARTEMDFQGQVSGLVTSVTQARANEASVAANNAALEIDSRQSNYGLTLAQTVLENPEAYVTGGLQISTAAYGNNVVAGGRGTFISGEIEQNSSGETRAESLTPARYVPGAAILTADASANAAQLSSNATSGQRVSVRQSSEGWTASESVSSAGNAWASTTVATASANRLNAYNAGGSQVITNDQESHGGVSSRASTFAYDYGDLRAMAEGTGNQASITNQDIWLEIDNSQLNTGGVSVEAQLQGHNGYDAYVGANATGNSISGFACSDCGSVLTASSEQTNHGNVTAKAVTNISAQARSVITGTTATGNSASFFITKPGG